MSSSHRGSRLLLSGNSVQVDANTFYLDFNNDTSGIQFGDLIIPSGNPVVTIRPYEGVYGGGIAIEEGTTNMMSNPMFDNNVNGWNNGNIAPTWNSGFNDIKQNNGYMYVVGSSSNCFIGGQSLSNLVSGGTYTVSAYIEGDGMDVSNIVTVGGTVFYSGNSVYDDYTWSPSLNRYTKMNDRGMYRIEQTFTLNQGSNSSSIFDYYEPRIGIKGSYINIKVYGYQLENKAFSTSVVNGTRVKGMLSYFDNGIDHTQGTLAFWYKPTINWGDTSTSNGSNEGTHEDLFTWGLPGQPNCIWSRRERDNNVINFWYGGASGQCGYTTTSLSGNQFIHIAFAWQGGNQKLYINGNYVSSSTNALMPRPTTGYFEIGTRQFGSSYPNANGIISDFIISRNFMSAEDINDIYISNRPLFNPFDRRAYAL